jgi:hypothetical protein
MPDPVHPSNVKPRKPRAPKQPSRTDVKRVKSTIHLSAEASQRLTVHAAMMGLDRSALVERLIDEHLRRYVVSDRGGKADDRAADPIRLADDAKDAAA